MPPTLDPPTDRHVGRNGTDHGAEWDVLIAGLAPLRDRTDDWDGQGAVAPPADIVAAAVRLAHTFRDRGWPPADFAVGTVGGTVVFEWKAAGGSMDVEVVSPDYADGYHVPRGADLAERFTLGGLATGLRIHDSVSDTRDG